MIKMVEKVYTFSTGDEKTIEKVLFDENIHYIHLVLNKDDGLPVHYSNSNVYMTILRGLLSIGLDDQDINSYGKGTMLKIPVNTKMNVRNNDEDPLEILIVKAPAPVSPAKEE